MADRITGKDVRRQLKADLIGKDSYRGVTLTYSWLANQLGHFTLGFIPSMLVYLALERWTGIRDTPLWSAIIIGCIWTVFEAYNLLGPLLSHRQSSAKNIYIPTKQRYTFQPDWKNVIFDTVTDVLFFWTGAFAAGLYLSTIQDDCINTTCPRIFLYILAVLFILLIYPCRYWFRTKMYIQEARYPSQFRLSQWSFDLAEPEKQIVSDFLHSTGNNHLLIFGGMGTGKTSLSVGLATELSIRHQACSYTTGVKLYTLFAEMPVATNKTLWSWRDADVLVLDDINPGAPVKKDLVTAQQFFDMLNYQSTGAINIDALKKKKVIWVMGGNDAGTALKSWMEMLHKIGVTDASYIELGIKPRH